MGLYDNKEVHFCWLESVSPFKKVAINDHSDIVITNEKINFNLPIMH